MRTTRLLTVLLTTGLTALAGVGLAPSPANARAAVPPGLSITDVSWPVFFPARDAYKDTVDVTYELSDPDSSSVLVTWEVEDSQDEVVASGSEEQAPGEHTWTWDGRIDGALAAAGDYQLILSAQDDGDEVAVDRETVTVDRGKLQSRTFTQQVGPRDSAIDRQVGRCSALRYPAPRRGWIGSLGYYSNVRCDRSGRPSLAATVNGLVVPRAYSDDDFPSFYDNVRIRAYGGAARTRPRSRARLQYWLPQRETWGFTKFLDSRVGGHAGRRAGGGRVVGLDRNDDPYVAWSLATGNGNRYDLRTFTLVLRYRVMVRPRTPSPARTAAGAVPLVTAPQVSPASR